MQEAESQAVLSSSDEIPDGQQVSSHGRITRVKAAQSKPRQASSSKVTGIRLCSNQTDPPTSLTSSGRQHSLCQSCAGSCTMKVELSLASSQVAMTQSGGAGQASRILNVV